MGTAFATARAPTEAAARLNQRCPLATHIHLHLYPAYTGWIAIHFEGNPLVAPGRGVGVRLTPAVCSLKELAMRAFCGAAFERGAPPVFPHMPLPDHLKAGTDAEAGGDGASGAEVDVEAKEASAQVHGKPGMCRICDKWYVNEFVNVVEFITLKKAMGTDGKRQQPGHKSAGRVPVQAKLCSYACFRSEGHKFHSAWDQPLCKPVLLEPVELPKRALTATTRRPLVRPGTAGGAVAHWSAEPSLRGGSLLSAI